MSSGATAVCCEADVDELLLVEGGVGDGEAALRRHPADLGPTEAHLVADGGLPPVEEHRRA